MPNGVSVVKLGQEWDDEGHKIRSKDLERQEDVKQLITNFKVTDAKGNSSAQTAKEPDENNTQQTVSNFNSICLETSNTLLKTKEQHSVAQKHKIQLKEDQTAI